MLDISKSCYYFKLFNTAFLLLGFCNMFLDCFLHIYLLFFICQGLLFYYIVYYIKLFTISYFLGSSGMNSMQLCIYCTSCTVVQVIYCFKLYFTSKKNYFLKNLNMWVWWAVFATLNYYVNRKVGTFQAFFEKTKTISYIWL